LPIVLSKERTIGVIAVPVGPR